MFTNIDLQYDYTIEAPANGTVNRNMLTPNMGNVTVYHITKDETTAESLSVYDGGLVVYAKNTADKSVVKTNYPFVDDGQGNLVVSPA